MKNSYFHYNFLKLKISTIMKELTLKIALSILDINQDGRVSQIFYLRPSFYFVKCCETFSSIAILLTSGDNFGNEYEAVG